MYEETNMILDVKDPCFHPAVAILLGSWFCYHVDRTNCSKCYWLAFQATEGKWWSRESWKYPLCHRPLYSCYRKGSWRSFLKRGKGWSSGIALVCWMYFKIAVLFLIFKLFLLCYAIFIAGYWLPPCSWTSNQDITWFWLCDNGQPWGCWSMYKISESINPWRALHHSGEGKVSPCHL